jgi:hypothetical protein
VHLFKFLKFMTSPFLALTPVKTGAQRAILMISHDLIWVKALACIVLGMWSIAMSPTLRRSVIVRPPYHLLVVGRHGDQGGHNRAMDSVSMSRMGGGMGQGRVAWLCHRCPAAP